MPLSLSAPQLLSLLSVTLNFMLLSIVDGLLSIVYCLLSIVYCLLPYVYCLLTAPGGLRYLPTADQQCCSTDATTAQALQQAEVHASRSHAEAFAPFM